MKLRPHHLLCLQKYTGHGYDAVFTARMDAVTACLKADPDTPITLVRGCDDLCGYCPKREADGARACLSRQKTAAMDEAVLALCGLCPGDVIPWKEAAARAEARIFRAGKTEAVCGTCEWFPLCRDTGAVPKAGIIQGPEIMQTTEVIQNE